jgi:CheY-like chemotaxis protein
LPSKSGQADLGIERCRGHEHQECDALAGSGLAADQHVALGEGDGDDLAVLADADRDRVPKGADPGTAAVPVVILTANATSREKRRLFSAGANAYVAKPFDLDQASIFWTKRWAPRGHECP